MPCASAGSDASVNAWRELAGLTSVPFRCPDVLLHLGNQVDAGKAFPAAITAIHEHERVVGVPLQVWLFAVALCPWTTATGPFTVLLLCTSRYHPLSGNVGRGPRNCA